MTHPRTGPVDLRSDTVTRPGPGMLAAMSAAEVGDDVYGEDPTVRALEERVAGLFGHEAGLFTVTGSMANLLGVASLVRPGQELLCEERAHVVRAELGAHAALTGVTTRTWSHPRGLPDLGAIAALAAPDAGPYFVSTAAVTVENTHNFAGGAVVALDLLERLRTQVGVALGLHLDGARVWNAHVASGVALDAYGRLFDTVAVCFSKGLGAPVGSMLLSSADRIAAARVARKRLGGGWRQAGVLAAACAYALDHHVADLARDHAHAAELATVLADAAPGCVDVATVQTNIVVVDVAARGRTSAEVVAAARTAGVLVGPLDAGKVRVVTHRDADTAACRRAAELLARLLA